MSKASVNLSLEAPLLTTSFKDIFRTQVINYIMIRVPNNLPNSLDSVSRRINLKEVTILLSRDKSPTITRILCKINTNKNLSQLDLLLVASDER